MAIDVAESENEVKKFAVEKKIPFPVLLDVDGEVSTAYGVRSHPAHFLVNGRGELAASSVGARDWASYKSRDLIRHLIELNQ